MKKLNALMLIAVVLTASIQCSKRDNPVDVEIPQGSLWNLTFHSQSIDGDMMLDPPQRGVIVYTPPNYDVDSSTVTYPVVYLLHGFGGTENYFTALFSLQDLMDEMIYNGEIDPMIVVTPNATNALGGSFYTNSFAYVDTLAPAPDSSQSFAGLMEDFITDEVVAMTDSLFNTDATREKRGISGHSMGGYGALKLAMLRNDLFGSAASMSGPIAFWGGYPVDTTYLGLLDLIPYVFAENSFTPGDTAAFYSIAPGVGKRLTNMMFSMASAFSPHHPNDSDTTYAHLFSTIGFVGRVDLPFGADGQVAMPIWNRWMTHDVTALYGGGYGGVFANTDLYVDCGQEDDLGLYGMAQVFQSVAMDNIDQFEIYSGFDDFYPPDHITLVAERLKGALKFHNASFDQ